MTSEMEPGEKKESPDLELLVRQAEEGDTQAIEQLRKEFSEGRVDAYLNRVGDMARHAEEALLEAATGEQLLMRRGIRRQMEAMRRELAGPKASPLERLLVERVVLCWGWDTFLDTLAPQSLKIIKKHFPTGLKEMTTFGDYITRQQNHAHHRLLEAAKVLAQIRRLEVPVIQLNVAEKQINLAG